jgi:hypothetical protein
MKSSHPPFLLDQHRLVAQCRLSAVRSDWTDGCIALDSHHEVEAIARWVVRTRARWIELE